MAEKTRTELNAYFEAGDTPTEAQFNDLIDSVPNFQDDDDYYGREIAITAHAGGGQANAYQLSKNINRVGITATDHDSVKLPAGSKARIFYIWNDGACILDIYPPVGGFMNNLAVNIPVELPANSRCIGINYDTGSWYSIC